MKKYERYSMTVGMVLALAVIVAVRLVLAPALDAAAVPDADAAEETFYYIQLNPDSSVYDGGGFVWVERAGLFCAVPIPLQTRWVARTTNYPLGVDGEQFRSEVRPVLCDAGLAPFVGDRDNSDTIVVTKGNRLVGVARYSGSSWYWIWTVIEESVENLGVVQEQGTEFICALEGNPDFHRRQEKLHRSW